MAFSRPSRSCETRCRELWAGTKLEKTSLKMKDGKAHLQRIWGLFSVGRTQTFAFKPNLIMHSSDLHNNAFFQAPTFPPFLNTMFSHSVREISVASTANGLKIKVIVDETSRSWMFGKQPNVSLINSNIFDFDWPFQTESEKHWGWKQPLEII